MNDQQFQSKPVRRKGWTNCLVIFFSLLFLHQLLVPPSSQHTETATKQCSSLWQTSGQLNQNCIRQIAKVYPSRTDPKKWCIPPSNQPNIYLKRPQLLTTPPHEETVGILFIKNTKAASSTGAGVTLRIAEQIGKRVLPSLNTTAPLAFRSCVRNWTHAFANARAHAPRNPRNSLLWTILRQPDERDLSAFYFFEHARKGVPDDDDTVRTYLEAQKSGQFRYLHTNYIADDNRQPGFRNWWKEHEHESELDRILRELLQFYDFIAIAERWDESMAVLTLLWNLQPSDVVVLSAKTSGGYDDGKFQKQCHKIPKSTPSPAIRKYLQSTDYRHNNLDWPLYAAANASLDRTIKALGTAIVQERVELLKRLQQRANEQCQDVAVYPCSSTGELQRAAAQQSCYIDDSGCGHACVDRVLGSLDS